MELSKRFMCVAIENADMWHAICDANRGVQRKHMRMLLRMAVAGYEEAKKVAVFISGHLCH